MVKDSSGQAMLFCQPHQQEQQQEQAIRLQQQLLLRAKVVQFSQRAVKNSVGNTLNIRITV